MDVADIVIHPDGSWVVAEEHGGSTDLLTNKKCTKLQDNKIISEPNEVLSAVASSVDLTIDGDGESAFTFGGEDIKPFHQFPCSAERPFTHHASGISEGGTSQQEDDIWSRSWSLASMSTSSSVSGTVLNCPRVEGLASLINDIILNPVVTDANTPTLGLEPTANNPGLTFHSVSQSRGPIIANACSYASYQAVPSTTAISVELSTISGDIGRQMVSRTSFLVSPLPQLQPMTQVLFSLYSTKFYIYYNIHIAVLLALNWGHFLVSSCYLLSLSIYLSLRNITLLYT